MKNALGAGAIPPLEGEFPEINDDGGAEGFTGGTIEGNSLVLPYPISTDYSKF